MIETERLLIKPLTLEQLKKYIQNDGSLEIELNIGRSLREISPELKDALERAILPNVADLRKNYLFSTLWTMILKPENCMVGDLCFVGEPDTEGQVEIGYGTYDRFQKRGYMTEAVGGMVMWAAKHTGIFSIFAETEKVNLASFAVLEKNGFAKSGETGTTFHWRLKLK